MWSFMCKNTTVCQVYVGNLTVPLSPHAEDADETPHIDLLVIMTIPNSAADVSKLILKIAERGQTWNVSGFVRIETQYDTVSSRICALQTAIILQDLDGLCVCNCMHIYMGMQNMVFTIHVTIV